MGQYDHQNNDRHDTDHIYLKYTLQISSFTLIFLTKGVRGSKLRVSKFAYHKNSNNSPACFKRRCPICAWGGTSKVE